MLLLLLDIHSSDYIAVGAFWRLVGGGYTTLSAEFATIPLGSQLEQPFQMEREGLPYRM